MVANKRFRVELAGRTYAAARSYRTRRFLLCGLRNLHIEMREHSLQRLSIHVSLEFVPILERHGLLRCRSRADLIHEAFQIRKLLPTSIAQHSRNEPRPAPYIHVDD